SYADEIAEFSQATDMAAVEWMLSAREGITVLENYPNSSYRVKYEDLVSQPESVISDILEFCELEPDRTVTHFAQKELNERSVCAGLDLHPVIFEHFRRMMLEFGYVDVQSE
ncbi:MAG: sulfotransferase domain-containing protein, partial [Gammaproteobacteria bacterium]|nr:sulfotransferase domain-containing protein [Gammaproteobacteria bacterium]